MAAAERLRAAYEAEEGWRRFAAQYERPLGSHPTGAPAPDADAAVFLGESQREAFAVLGRAFVERHVCVALTGPAGAGKTALIEAALTGLPGAASRVLRIEDPAAVDDARAERIARIGLGRSAAPAGAARASQDADPLDPAAADAEGRASVEGGPPGDSGAIAPASRRRSRGDSRPASRSRRDPGENTLLVVDDAHAASPALLRCLARVAAAGRDGGRAAQLLLVGRPELWERLERDGFARLAEKLVLRLDLKPWTEADARGYIAHLLARPRRVVSQSLGAGAEHELVRRSQARPERLLALMGAAFSLTDLRTRPTVTLRDVLAAGGALTGDGARTGPEMDRGDPSPAARDGEVRPPRSPVIAAPTPARPPFDARAAAVALAVAGAVAGGFGVLRHALSPDAAVVAVPAPTPSAPAPGQAAPVPVADGPAGRPAEGAPAPPASLAAVTPGGTIPPAPVAPTAPAGGRAPHDPGAPTPAGREGGGVGAVGATGEGTTGTLDAAPPPDRPEGATASGAPGRPSPAPDGGGSVPDGARGGFARSPDPPPGPEEQPLARARVAVGAEAAAPTGEDADAVPGEGGPGSSPVAPAAARPRDPAAGPAAPLSAATLAALLRRGDEMLAGGDPTGARRFYERAAAAGSAPGMRGMARSFDPAVIGPSGAPDDAADPAAATAWYTRAAALGDAQAAARLRQLERTR